jgi:hypothetical protein
LDTFLAKSQASHNSDKQGLGDRPQQEFREDGPCCEYSSGPTSVVEDYMYFISAELNKGRQGFRTGNVIGDSKPFNNVTLSWG